MKGALNAEKEERVAEDEQIVHAVNDYTRALQDGWADQPLPATSSNAICVLAS